MKPWGCTQPISRDLEKRMRIESPQISQSLIESSKPIEKKELTGESQKLSETPEDDMSFVPSAFGFSGTYSVTSLKAAVDYNAKYMTVAESNAQAAKSMTMIPKAILNYFNS
jgi:hypothetical protein